MRRYTHTLLAGCAALLAFAAQAQSPPRDSAARDSASEEYRQSLSYRDYLRGKNLRASEVIGAQVRNAEAENLGEIEDLVIASGTDMVIFSVGGVLNVGDKLVAVPYEELRVSADGDTFYVNQEQLEAAPVYSYEKQALQPQQSAAAPAARGGDDDGENRSAAARTETEIQQEINEGQREIQRETNEAQREIERAANAAQRDAETSANERAANQRDARDADERDAQRPTVAARPAAKEPTTLGTGDYRGSDIIGAVVLDSTGEKVAEIDDLVLSRDDNKIHAVLSVGGVAGLGAKLVSVPLDDLTISPVAEDRDGLNVRIDATADQLESRPQFRYERQVALERATGPGA